MDESFVDEFEEEGSPVMMGGGARVGGGVGGGIGGMGAAVRVGGGTVALGRGGRRRRRGEDPNIPDENDDSERP
jgi:hypothetical protein